MIVLQFVLGDLVSNELIGPTYHIALGFLVLAMALATMVVALTSKLSLRSLKLVSILLVVLVALQIPLGFALLGSGSLLSSVAHVVNAIAILVITFSGYFLARNWEKRRVQGSREEE